MGRKNRSKELLLLLLRRVYVKLWRTNLCFLPFPRTPHIVSLELTNDCNAKCSFCPRNYEDRKLGYIDIKLFKKLIDEISSYPWCFLRIVGLGEPSLHPKLEEMMNYLGDKLLKVEIATPGEAREILGIVR